MKDRVGEGRACWSLGNCYGTLGRPEKALLYAGQHLEISKEVSLYIYWYFCHMSMNELLSLMSVRY